MTALQDALRHPNNSAAQLVRWLHAELQASTPLNGITESGNFTICDFRKGCEEKDPSLSCDTKPSGAVFNRFGGDGFKGGAVEFVMSCLNVSQAESAKVLIDRAGLVDTLATHGEKKKPSFNSKQKAGLAKVQESLAKLKPLSPEAYVNALRGWVKIEAGEDTPEGQEIARRGLDSALLSGSLVAYRWHGEVNGKTLKRWTLAKNNALVYEVRGADGKVWNLKARNAGLAEHLKDMGTHRYVAIVKGQSTPAWCSPHHDRPSHIVIEGEFNGVAVFEALEASTMKGLFNVQGVAGSEGLPHVDHIKADEEVYIFTDEDEAGKKARRLWGDVLSARGAVVKHLPPALFGEGLKDACDVAGGQGLEALGALILQGLQEAKLHGEEEKPIQGLVSGDVWPSKKNGYGVRNGALCALAEGVDSESGDKYVTEEPLCNFTAFITSQVRLIDGSEEAPMMFQIEGAHQSGRSFPMIRVSSSEFDGLKWATKDWGAGAIVRAGNGKKDKLREAIQQLSNPTDKTVYLHTGWINHEEHGAVYLTAGACIGQAGAVEGLEVELSGRLAGYALPNPTEATQDEIREAVRESLDLLNFAPDYVSVPVMGALYRSPLGRADFVVWLTGETGRNKTAYLGLIQAHYGTVWNREYLPDGWHSSANALERTAFTVKDALFLVDDFKPQGSSGQNAQAYGQVARLIQGVADGAGRSTLKADRSARAGLYPRGLFISSSEDLPRGHSNRARAVIVEVGEALLGRNKERSKAYFDGEEKGKAGVYALAMASYIQALAGSDCRTGSAPHKTRKRELLSLFEGAHGRTGANLAELAYGWEVFLSFAVQIGAISGHEAGVIWARVGVALMGGAASQKAHLSESDPVERALETINALLSSGQAYINDAKTNGIPPEDVAGALGFQRYGEEGKYSAKGGAVLLGWYYEKGGDQWLCFNQKTLHAELQRVASKQGGALFPDEAKLFSNMRDRFHPKGFMRCDKDGEGIRTSAKTPIEEHGRPYLINLRASLILEGLYVSTETSETSETSTHKTTFSTVFKPVSLTTIFNGLTETSETKEDLLGAEEWIA